MYPYIKSFSPQLLRPEMLTPVSFSKTLKHQNQQNALERLKIKLTTPLIENHHTCNLYPIFFLRYAILDKESIH